MTHAALCPICSHHVAHDEQAVSLGDELAHFDCVREVDTDIASLGEPELFEIFEEEGGLEDLLSEDMPLIPYGAELPSWPPSPFTTRPRS